MTKTIANTRFSKVAAMPLPLCLPALPEALDEVRMSVDRFCLLAGIETLNEMLTEDAAAICGPRHGRSPARRGYRWGTRAPRRPLKSPLKNRERENQSPGARTIPKVNCSRWRCPRWTRRNARR